MRRLLLACAVLAVLSAVACAGDDPQPDATDAGASSAVPNVARKRATRAQVAPAKATPRKRAKWRTTRFDRLVVYALEQEPRLTSPVNPGNRLKLDRFQLHAEYRSDLVWKSDRYEIIAKPRAVVQGEWVLDGIFDGDRRLRAVAYPIELVARRRFVDNLFVSLGQENLQWGPAILASVSNPFLVQNQRTVPQVEIPGLVYGRLVWVPDQTWTLSLIANPAEGPLQTVGHFEKTYATKLDWMGSRRSGGLIVSHTERRSSELGYYGIWNVSDPLILYSEGRLAERGDSSTLVGGSYTFKSGPVVHVEGFYDRLGTVPVVVAMPGALKVIGDLTPSSYSTRLVMAQYNTGPKYQKVNATLRFDHSLDDGTRAITSASYTLPKATDLWMTAIGNGGTGADRFQLLTRHVVLIGLTRAF